MCLFGIGFRRGSHRYRRPSLWYCTSGLGTSCRLRVQKKLVRSADRQTTINTGIMLCAQRIQDFVPTVQILTRKDGIILTILFLFVRQNKIADMALRVESARLLTWRAAYLKDTNTYHTKVILF